MAIGCKQPDSGDEGGEEAIFAEINITPLTDVFLVMVVIFMVTALAQTDRMQKETKAADEKQQKDDQEKKSGIKINLPSGQAQELDTRAQSLVLEVPLSGDVVVGGKPMSDAQLDAVFRAAFVKDKSTQVVLKADKGVQHGRVVNLMERAKQVGLTHLAIGTSSGG